MDARDDLRDGESLAQRLAGRRIIDVQRLGSHHVRVVLYGASLEIHARMRAQDVGPRIELTLIEGGQ